MKFFRSGVMFRALALSLCLMAAPFMAVGSGFLPPMPPLPIRL